MANQEQEFDLEDVSVLDETEYFEEKTDGHDSGTDPLKNREAYAKKGGTGQVYKKTHPKDKVGMSQADAYAIRRAGPKTGSHLPEETVDEETMAGSSLHPAAKSVADPKSKIEMITHVIGAMHAMRKDDLTKWFKDTQATFGPNKDHGVADKSGANQSSIDMHASAASATTGPKTRDAMPKLSVKEDVEEMFVGEELSEEFKDKATTLFEAAVNARASIEIARLEEEYETKFNESLEQIHEELSSKVDSYLDYVVEDWMKENEVAIESTLRNELTEEFIDGLKKLFAEHYIDVPEEKVSVVESLAEKVSELEQKLDETITENVEMKRTLVESERVGLIGSFAEDLTVTQQEKFASLAEGIDFTGDLETYAKKLEVIKETYFSSNKKPAASTNIEEETFEGEAEAKTIAIDPVVNRYVQAISKSVKK